MTRIVSARVAALLRRHSIQNLELTRLSERREVFEIGLRDLLPADYEQCVTSAYRRAGQAVPEQYRGSAT